MLKRHGPGGCCCDVCGIDAFADAVEVTDANSRTIRSKAHPQSPYASWLQLEMLVEPSGIGVILLAWDDSTPGDGIYIEFTPDSPGASSGYISVYTKDDARIAGPLYVRGGVSDEWHTFTVCYDPDKIPDQLVITFDPADTDIETQQFSVIVPDGFTAGTKAGYGTGNATGDVSVRNYDYDRLWYCGNGTEDCHEFADEWDYYYDLPERVACHTCNPCPTSLAGGTVANWVQVSGTWTTGGATTLRTGDANAEVISIGGTSWFKTARVTVSIPGSDTAIVGMSDAIGYNKLYLLLEFTGGPATDGFGYSTPSATVAWHYDEDAETFHFWIYGLTSNVPTESLVWEVFKVTNGGSPTSIDGPNTLTLSTYLLPYYFAYTDGTEATHAPMRKLLMGTVTKTESIDTIFSSDYADCGCTVPMARQYTATVAGVATGSPVCNDGIDRYFDVSLMNLGPVTLKSYDHYDVFDSCFNQEPTTNKGQCGFSYAQILDLGGFDQKFSQIWIWAWQDGEYTEIRGYVYATHRPTTAAGACRDYASAEVEFRLRYFGSLDMRTISGLTIPVYGSSQRERVGMSPACTNPSTWLDTSGASLTLTAAT